VVSFRGGFASKLSIVHQSRSNPVPLYGLRMPVKQSYKQVKRALGWSDYQVRSVATFPA